MDTAKRMAPAIMLVYCFGLQNLRRHMCCKAIKWAVVVAQLVERSLPIPEVPGSNPVIGNIIY